MGKSLKTLLLAIFILLLSACMNKSLYDIDRNTILFLEKTINDENILFVQFGGGEIEEVTNDFIKDSYKSNRINDKFLYQDSDFDLYLVEKGKEKLKVGSDIEGTYNYHVTNDGKVIYLDRDEELILVTTDQKQIELSDDVFDYYLSIDEKYVSFVNKDEQLFIVMLDDQRKIEVSSDVFLIEHMYTGTDNYVYYIKNDFSLYRADLKGNEEKIAEDSNVLQASLDGDVFTYLSNDFEDLNLYVRDNHYKIASNTETVHLLEDGSKVLYINENTDLYTYDVKAEESTKLASNVYIFIVNKNEIYYLSFDDELFVIKGNEAPKLLNNKIIHLGRYNNGDVYYITEEMDLYIRNEKVLTDIKDYLSSANNLYILTNDEKIGVIEKGKKKLKLLAENIQEYSKIDAEYYTIYEKALTFNDIKGYWQRENKFFVSIEDIQGQTTTLVMYDLLYNDTGYTDLTLMDADSSSITAKNEYSNEEMQLTLIDLNTLQLSVNREQSITFTKSNIEEFIEQQEIYGYLD
ncbi:hypothetical protein MTP04_19240 [Lysinibacillus sp. PLM2]|nr:hypothetical protein MTP04_19240 [Lysinibacillus sp. PLM2]